MTPDHNMTRPLRLQHLVVRLPSILQLSPMDGLPKCLAAVFVLATLPSSLRAAEPKPTATKIAPAIEAELVPHLQLVYARYGDRELHLDLYRPRGGTRSPAILCIHGGGWWQGSRNGMTNLAKALAARGYVAATLSYRLSGEAAFPAAIHDCKAAIRFLRANAAEYGIDPDRMGATGLSAGGHLAALLATSGGVASLEGDGGHGQHDSRIQAAVPMGAQSDFSIHEANIERSDPDPDGAKPNIWVQFLGGKPSEVPERWQLASPLHHLDADDPPMMFLSGENDRDSTKAKKFRARMDQLGIPQGYRPIPNAPHAFLGRQIHFDQAIEQTVHWFDTFLKIP